MSKIVKLKYPYKYGQEEITEITLRRPKGKDLRKLPAAMDTGDILNLAAALSGHAPSVIDEMDAEDVVEVIEAVSDFLPGSRPTGKSV